MTEQTRWNLKVSRDTDIALRTLLAGRGARKGDLSRFVEEAVNREVLRQMLRENWERNADLDPDEVQKLVDEEVAAYRRERRGREADETFDAAAKRAAIPPGSYTPETLPPVGAGAAAILAAVDAVAPAVPAAALASAKSRGGPLTLDDEPQRAIALSDAPLRGVALDD